MEVTLKFPDLSKVRNSLILLRSEPAVLLLAVNAAASIGTAWGLNLTPQVTSTILVATTAALSLLIAVLARPASIPVIKGAIISLFAALEGFHLHLSQPKIAGTVAGLSLLLGLLFRQNLTPIRNRPVAVDPTVPPPGPGTVGLEPKTDYPFTRGGKFMPNPTLSVTTDKASYAAGEAVVLTAVFTDDQTETLTVVVSANATDAGGNSVSANTSFTSVVTAPQPMTVAVTDDHSDTYTQVSDNGAGTVVFSTTAPAA